MNGGKTRPVRQFQFYQAQLVVALICVMVALQGGCGKVIRRAQSPDSAFNKNNARKSTTRFIGDVCGVKGLRPEQLEGIGLVVGLEGTGSDPAPSGQKDYLFRELKSNKSTGNAKAAIASPNTSMVMLRGLIPPGAKKGDRMDIEIVTLPDTDTTSLKYGELLPTELRPMAFLSRSVKLGNVMGSAQGRVLVDSLFDGGRDEQSQLKGRILGGGIIGEDRDLTLVIKTEETSVKVTRSVAYAINQRYSTYTASGRDNTATPVTDRIIELRVPQAYQYNLGRFIQSLLAMSYGESVDDRVDRLDELDRRISDPATSQQAAIELEAIGDEGLPSLERAIKHPDFEVRFFVAEVLAYMGRSDGIAHLKLAAESEPAFRWHALTALASIDSKAAKTALIELFDVQSAETRYGAFRALTACCPDDHRIKGQLLANDFHFHQIDSKGPAMIHFSRTRRPEIVIFGSQQSVADNFLYVEAGLTVKAVGNQQIQITRFDPVDGESQFFCSAEIPELIRTLVKLGFGYTSMLELFREAHGAGTLNSRLVINAAPRIGSKSMADSVNGRFDNDEISERYIASPAPDLFSDVDSNSSDPADSNSE